MRRSEGVSVDGKVRIWSYQQRDRPEERELRQHDTPAGEIGCKYKASFEFFFLLLSFFVE